MSQEILTKDEATAKSTRFVKINKYSKIGGLIFAITLILHMYFFRNDWSFITSFFSGNPLPWIMLAFTSMLVYFFVGTYLYFRKHL
jgi:multisubunit Na+/H+ antiporter MnhB subunit